MEATGNKSPKQRLWSIVRLVACAAFLYLLFGLSVQFVPWSAGAWFLGGALLALFIARGADPSSRWQCRWSRQVMRVPAEFVHWLRLVMATPIGLRSLVPRTRPVSTTAFLLGFAGIAAYTFLMWKFGIPFINDQVLGIWQWWPVAALVLAGITLSWLVLRQTMVRSLLALGSSLIVVWGLVTAGSVWLFAWQGHQGALAYATALSMEPEPLAKMRVPANAERYAPRSTAQEWLNSLNNDPRLTTRQAQIYFGDFKAYWLTPLVIDDFERRPSVPTLVGSILKTVVGVCQVEAGQNKMVSACSDDAFFLFGPDSFIIKSALQANCLPCTPARVNFIRKPDGQWVYLVSMTGPRLVQAWGVATFMEDLWSVYEINWLGWTTRHSVEDAARLFPGAVLFPPELALKRAKMYAAWNGGLQSRFVTGARIFQVSADGQPKHPEDNAPPYTQRFRDPVTNQLIPYQWFALEPDGPGKSAMVGFLYFNATTGQPSIWYAPSGVNLNGPERARLSARNNQTLGLTDWTDTDLIEPLQAMRCGKLFFQVAAVAHDATNAHNLQALVLVGAEHRDPHTVNTLQALNDFLACPEGSLAAPPAPPPAVAPVAAPPPAVAPVAAPPPAVDPVAAPPPAVAPVAAPAARDAAPGARKKAQHKRKRN
jgi:hypothetical protein